MIKLLPTLVTALLVCTTSTFADPTGGSLFQTDYLLSSYDRPQWTVAFYHGSGSRGIQSGAATGQMNIDRNQLRIGYNLQDWLSALLYVGPTKLSLEGSGNDTETELMYGLHARLLSHDFENVQMEENQFRVDATFMKTDASGDFTEWEETNWSVMMSLVNMVKGNHQFVPVATVFKLGPVWSTVDGKVGNSSISEDSNTGLGTGIEIYFNKSMSFEWEFQKFEEDFHTFGLRFRF